MRALIWLLRGLVFVVLLAFAVLNTEPVMVRFYPGGDLQMPLVVLLFAFFSAGALLALVSVSGGFFRLRRENARLRRANDESGRVSPAA